MVLSFDEENYLGQNMLKLEIPGRRGRGSPERRYLDIIKEDMVATGVTMELAENRI